MTTTDYEDPEIIGLYKELIQLRKFDLYPSMLRALGDIQGRKITEIGSADGELARQMAAKGADVVAVEPSEMWWEEGGFDPDSPNPLYLRTNGADMSPIKTWSQDAVVMNMVMPNIAKSSDLADIFLEAGRITRKGGRFLVSDLHMEAKRCMEARRYTLEYDEGFSLAKDGSLSTRRVTLPSGREIAFRNVHYTEDTVRDLFRWADFGRPSLTGTRRDSVGDDSYRLPFPEFIIYTARKW